MKNHCKLKLPDRGWGSLLFEVRESKRSFYLPENLENMPFKMVFGGSDVDCEPFCLMEWQKVQYTYLVEKKSRFSPPFRLIINNRIENMSEEIDNNYLLSGIISFDDQAGRTKIEIRDNLNHAVLLLETEVYPQKMDYKSDYNAMMADISSIIHNLAYDAFRDTFRYGKTKTRGFTTENEWWNILDLLFDQLVLNLNVIARQPKHEIIRHNHVTPIEKIRKASKKNTDWLRKNGRFSSSCHKGICVFTDTYFTHALSEKKYISYDIYENRFVAWAVDKIIDRLKNYKYLFKEKMTRSDYSIISKKIEKYQGRLQRILHEHPFNAVSNFEMRSYFSTSLNHGAGYRDFYYIYLMLLRGLEIADNEIFRIELKDMSLLYEYWCFIKLVQIVKEQNVTNMGYQDLIKISRKRCSVNLMKGKSSEVQFIQADSGEKITLYYNKTFRMEGKKIFTFDQKPDYSLKFKKNGFDKPFWFIFDAKYRFEENEGNVEKRNNYYNVPQDTIGQLHRYRDAILHTDPDTSTYRSAIKNLGGIILYPYPLSEDEFKDNVFFKSIGQVNIGALPFLPSKTGLAGDLINDLINKKNPEEHYEKYIRMDDSDYFKEKDEWRSSVTIATLPKSHQDERIKFIKEKNLYHVPYVKDINSRIYMTEQLLLCKAGTKEAFMYNVASWEIMTDKELAKAGTRWIHRTDKYIVFHIIYDQDIILPEKLTSLKYRYTTIKGLKYYLRDAQANRNYFYMTNPNAVRLLKELNKMKVEFKVQWTDDDTDPSKIEFILRNAKIYSSQNHNDFVYEFNNSRKTLTEIKLSLSN